MNPPCKGNALKDMINSVVLCAIEKQIINP